MNRIVIFATWALAGVQLTTAQTQITATQLVTSGGRVDWYTGSEHSLLAFDAAVAEGRTETFTVESDGSNRLCVTCGLNLSTGFVGQPAWRPGGVEMVVQAESENSQRTFFNSLLWGFDNDLWIVRRDGSNAEKIWDTPAGSAALHPHFDQTGTRLVFVERTPTATPEQKPWENWQIRIADYDESQVGLQKLSNFRTLRPNGEGIYEVHQFVGQRGLLYSFSPAGQPAGLENLEDLYLLLGDGSVWNLTETPDSVWNEHGQLMPTNQRVMAFMSDRFDSEIPQPRPLRTELYLAYPGESGLRLTYFNRTPQDAFVVKDLTWNREGTRVAFLVSSDVLPVPQIWTVNFE